MYIMSVKLPLFSTGLVSFSATSAGTPYTSTLTSGSTMEDFFLFTLGSCWAEMTWRQVGIHHVRLWKTLHNLGSRILNKKLQYVCVCVCVRNTHHDMERLVLQPVSSGQGDGVILCGYVPHVGRFQDVAALSVNQESALVNVHVRAGRLEV